MTDRKRPSTEQDRPGVARASESGPNRFIFCPHCRELIKPENEPDRVVIGHIVVTGHIKAPDVSCDRCGESLPDGAAAVAVTLYESPEDFEPWEHEYLTTR